MKNISELLGYRIFRIGIKMYKTVDTFFISKGLNVDQWIVLRTVQEHAPLCQKDLAQLINKNQNTVKALLDKLADKGLISRDVDAKDKRIINLSLSVEGTNVVEELSVLEQRLHAELMHNLSEEDQATLFELIGKIDTERVMSMKF